MCRSKRWAALCAALCMLTGTAAAESENILYISEEQQANYQTAEVTLGTFEQTFSTSAAPYYPYKHNLRVGVSGARFKEFLVSNGDLVTAGTPLMTFTRDVDMVELERKRISLRRSEESFMARKQSFEEELAQLSVEMSEAADTWQREALQLKITRKELERDKYILETEYSIANARKELLEMEADYAVTEIVAPADGEVKIVAFKQGDDRIASGEVVMTITEQRGTLFLIDNKNGYYRYGMDVSMEIGGNGNRITVDGKIVASDMLIPEARRQNYAFVQVDMDKLASVKLTRPQVQAQVYYLDNVMTLPKKAVTLADGKRYVMKLINGTPAKRYINYVMNSQNLTLLFDGAEPGEIIIVD